MRKTGVWVVVAVLAVGISLAVIAKRNRPERRPEPPPAPAPPSQVPTRPLLPPGPVATLKGRVVFEGEPPPRRQLPVDKDVEVCQCDARDDARKAPYKLDESLVVDPQGQGLANAVVWVKGLPGGEKRLDVKVDQRGCQFVPHVALLNPGGRITLLNPDGINHNFHWWSEANPAGNRTVSRVRKSLTMPEEGFPKPEFIRVTCDIHAWMGMWVAVVETPFAAVTDDKGSFSIPSLPPGEHTLGIWHETLAQQPLERTVTLGPEGGEIRIPLGP